MGSPYGADFNGISESEAANFSDEITFPYLESPLVDHFDGVDWNEIETFANSRPFDDGVGLSDEGVKTESASHTFLSGVPLNFRFPQTYKIPFSVLTVIVLWSLTF